MTEWWSGLGMEIQIYYALGIAATAVVVLQLLLTLIGLGDHGADAGDADMGGPVEHPGGLQLLSVRTVSAFFVGFGWAGVAAIQHGWGGLAAALPAAGSGCVFVAVVFFLMRSLYGLRHSGTLDYRNAVGQIAAVVLPVPAALAGSGQIEVMIQGRVVVAQAQTRGAARLENRAQVKVVDVVGPNRLLVEPIGPAGGATGRGG